MPPRVPGPWPYLHEQPDRVVLAPRLGVEPSPLPPVRIFLGTQPAQYRAERIFFWSIEQCRDPSRSYEIYRMSDLEGFDRRGWRTGFTKYRFAIPELAGGEGKAIYNDVDQIYLADPALLFDLDMGEHGYLAISPEETSVMLIDCRKMEPIWNRYTANSYGKRKLIRRPARKKGLWGPIDGHWNARDMEYVEGLTKCLHYTLLHEQPWEPTPEVYSYHANPLGYIWHRLERTADEARYQLFTAERPSPDFSALAAIEGGLPPLAPTGLAPIVVDRLMGAGVRRLVVVGFGSPPAVESLPYGFDAQLVDLARRGEVELDGSFDAVLACELFERLPPADIGWVMDGLFTQAEKLLVIDIRAAANTGFASPAWWERRVREAAAAHPGKSWHLEVRPDPRSINNGAISVTTHRLVDPPTPNVWVLATGEDSRDRQAKALAEELGWPVTVKQLSLNWRRRMPQSWLGASLRSVDQTHSAPLEAPWPDLVIACGRKIAPAAMWIREQSGGRARLIQIGRPRAPLDRFDLILATPQTRLPIRDNVLQIAAPLAGIPPERQASAATAWQPQLADATRPFIGLFVGSGRRGYVMDAMAAEQCASAVLHELERSANGTLLVHFHSKIDPKARAAFLERLRDRQIVEIDPRAGGEETAHAVVIALADELFVTADEAGALGEAAHTGRPVCIIDLPRRHERRPMGRAIASLLHLLAGGGVSYRGTPYQQHFVSRHLDERMVRGRYDPPYDLSALHRSLVARGLARLVGETTAIAKPQPLQELRRAATRIWTMMRERKEIVQQVAGR